MTQDPRSHDRTVFPDPVYKDTVLRPLFDGAKTHHVDGFRAKVKYQSGSTVKYQDVLIRDSSFRIGDSKFILTGKDADGNDTAQIATVATSPVTGVSTLEKAVATRS